MKWLIVSLLAVGLSAGAMLGVWLEGKIDWYWLIPLGINLVTVIVEGKKIQTRLNQEKML